MKGHVMEQKNPVQTFIPGSIDLETAIRLRFAEYGARSRGVRTQKRAEASRKNWVKAVEGIKAAARRRRGLK